MAASNSLKEISTATWALALLPMSQIRWRCTLDYAALPEPDKASEMYFPQELFLLRADEVVVDCADVQTSILDISELALEPAVRPALSSSLESYRADDLLKALADFGDRKPASTAEGIYAAAVASPADKIRS